MIRTPQRLGPESKCPACGTGLDPGAYRCPKCRIYFCFKCRKRVSIRDAQYQCVNQQCGYHGKLLCAGCTPMSDVLQDIAPEEYREGCGWWPLICIISLTLGVLFGKISAGAGLVAFLASGVAGVLVTVKSGKRVRMWNETKVTATPVPTVVGQTRTCVACKSPVEVLREP